jgi:galacturonokinase
MACATGNHRLIPTGGSANSWNILLAFSGLKQALVGTDYNRRVAECAEAARILLAAAGRTENNPVLAHVSETEYATHKARLPSPLDRRAEHFFGETVRVRDGINAWQRGDLREFGRLMTASGESSICNYECGCPPLIDLYKILVRCPGVFGARFSGAGFRGCCIALVERAAAAQATTEITRKYAECQPELATHAAVIIVHSDDGARKIGS